jgi:hypothetical protein
MTENMLTNNKKSMKIPKDVIRIRKSKQDIYCNIGIFMLFLLFVNMFSVMNIGEILLTCDSTTLNQLNISDANMTEKIYKSNCQKDKDKDKKTNKDLYKY